MIKQEDIDRIPSATRDSIKAYLEICMSKSHESRVDSAVLYTVTNDEKQRALSLIAQGEYDAFKVLYNIFK